MKITVYGKPHCTQCDATKRLLTRLGLDYDDVDLTETPAALEWVTEDLGYSQAPVVVLDDGTEQNHWSGFRPDKIKAAASAP